jgi:hypothetical protein
MRTYTAGIGATLAVFVIAASPPAVASTMSGSPDTVTDWTQEFCLTDCTATTTSSPITQIDIIMAPSSVSAGVSFTSLSSVSSLSGTPVNATTILGPTESTISFTTADTADVLLTLGFSPAQLSTPFSFYWEQWDGSQFITTDSSVTSSDLVSWNGSSWTITPMTAPVSTTPLPPAAPLFAPGLGLLAFMGCWRKRRMALDGEDAHQFATPHPQLR